MTLRLQMLHETQERMSEPEHKGLVTPKARPAENSEAKKSAWEAGKARGLTSRSRSEEPRLPRCSWGSPLIWVP